jgi:lipoprotein-anchoring transpeptidase ErfK/SrfK
MTNLKKGGIHLKWITFLITFLLLFTLNTASAEEDELYLLVEKSKNDLLIIMNDLPLYTFPVATGKTLDKTPEGTFIIIRKVKKPWYIPKNIPGGDPANPIGTRWLGLNVPETDGYKYGIHGTNDPSSIGKHVSQGCIRMRNEDIEWLFRHIPLGTKVRINP